VGIAYDQFNAWGKTVQIVLGKQVEANSLFPLNTRAKNMIFFNQQIKQQLEPLIIPPSTADPKVKRWMIFLSHLGIILHLPLFKIIQPIVKSKTANTVYYDSVLFGVLLFSYPLYLLLIGLFFYWLIGIATYLVVCLFVLSSRTIVLSKNSNE
jgi:hypothetical protein